MKERDSFTAGAVFFAALVTPALLAAVTVHLAAIHAALCRIAAALEAAP